MFNPLSTLLTKGTEYLRFMRDDRSAVSESGQMFRTHDQIVPYHFKRENVGDSFFFFFLLVYFPFF